MKNIAESDKVCGKESILGTKKYIVGMLAILFSVAVAWVVIPETVKHLKPKVLTESEINKIVYPGRHVPTVHKPIENSYFIRSVFAVPMFLLTFIFLFSYFLRDVKSLFVVKCLYNILFFICLSLIVYLAWKGNKSDNFFYFRNALGIGTVTIFFVALISFVMNLLILNPQKNRIFSIFSKILLSLSDSLCWIAILSVVSLCVFGKSILNCLPVADITTYHFNFLFYSVVQLYLGASYDIAHTHGFFPYILEPIWKIIGLSVFKFTLIMGLLVGISLILLYIVFKELVDNKIIRFLGFVSLIWVGYFYARFVPQSGFFDPYFEFHPLRFLPMVISIYFTYYYIKTSSKKIYYLSFVIYSIAVIWNLEFGLAIYLTWLITLVYEESCSRNIRKIFFHITNWVLIFLLTIGLFTLYMYLRYGHMPDYESLFLFRKAYYIAGASLLHTPLIHSWNLVIITYLIGMAMSLTNLLKGGRSLKMSMLFNLTILGIGIFVYYQSRSDQWKLLHICFPAIIMLTIFADELIKKIKNDKDILNFVALGFITFFMFYSSMSFVKNYKDIFTLIKERFKVSFKGKETAVTRTAGFIKNNVRRGEEVLIFSHVASVYCLESQVTIPKCQLYITTVDDANGVFNYLKSDSCKKVILDVNYPEKDVWDFVQRNFKLALVSPDRNVGIFVKE